MEKEIDVTEIEKWQCNICEIHYPISIRQLRMSRTSDELSTIIKQSIENF